MKSEIHLYCSRSGNEIIKKFILGLDTVTKAKLRNSLKLLSKHGLVLLSDRSVRKLSTKPDIFELRIIAKTQVRLLFTKYNKNTFLVLNGFVKKSQKTPIKEIKLAQRRINEFI